MRSSLNELPVAAEMPEGTVHQTSWGNMTIETARLRKDFDGTSLFRGLPDGRCQCPHWGYVLKGQMRLRYTDREEIYREGDVYYAPPGHIPLLEAGCEYVEFSPTDEYNKTMEAAMQSMNAQQ